MGGLARRLLVASIFCIIIAVACWWLLPRVGMEIPFYVPLVCFAVIVFGAILRGEEADGDDGEEDEPEIAGRIGDGEDFNDEV